jgi:hypothetical protein
MWAALFPDTPLSQRQWALWASMHSHAAMKAAFVALAKRLTKLESQGQTMPVDRMLAYASSVMNRVTLQGRPVARDAEVER